MMNIKAKRYTEQEIEAAARTMLRQSLRHFSAPATLADYLDAIDPERIAQSMGIDYIEQHHIPNPFGHRGKHFEIAGLLDRQSNRIVVSTHRGPFVARYTAFHELGHWLLHPNEVIHRDRPISALSRQNYRRSPIEWEADKFATFALMPARLVHAVFKRIFGVEQLRITDTIAQALQLNGYFDIMEPENQNLEAEHAVARYHTIGRESIAATFRVSDSAMALRLKELGLVLV